MQVKLLLVAESLDVEHLMLLTLMATSKGMAAVPRSSLVVLSGTLAQFGLPLEGIAVILGVDAIMDMGRTSVNVLGNCLAAVLMSRWEGTFAPPVDDDAMELLPAMALSLSAEEA